MKYIRRKPVVTPAPIVAPVETTNAEALRDAATAMKRVSAVLAEKVAQPAPASAPVVIPDIANAIALRDAASSLKRVSAVLAEKLQPPAPRPTAFSCKVTARDKEGRISDFDIFVKDVKDAPQGAGNDLFLEFLDRYKGNPQ